MNEPDSTPRRRPPVIDLTAKEVGTDPSDQAQRPAADDAARDRMAAEPDVKRDRYFLGRAQPYVVGAILGVIALGAMMGGFWLAGFAPTHGTALPREQDAKSSADEISARLDKIQQALRAPRADELLDARLAAAEAQEKMLQNLITTLTRRVDEVAAATENAATQAKAAAATAQNAAAQASAAAAAAENALTQGKDAAAAANDAKNASRPDVQRSDIKALDKRISTLEDIVKSLSADLARASSGADDRAARATVAAEALGAAVERGAPYEAELAAVKAFGAHPDAIAPLSAFAAEGLPSAASLARELTAIAPALERAVQPASNANSFFGQLESHAQKLVRVTPIEAQAGQAASASDDASSLVARINAAAARGDIGAGLTDIAKLPGAARAITENWVKKAEAREAAIAASRRIATEALALLGRPAQQ